MIVLSLAKEDKKENREEEEGEESFEAVREDAQVWREIEPSLKKLFQRMEIISRAAPLLSQLNRLCPSTPLSLQSFIQTGPSILREQVRYSIPLSLQ